MFANARKLISSLVLCAVGLAVGLFIGYPTDAADSKPRLLKSRVVSWNDAKLHEDDWGRMRFYFRGQTRSTKDVLIAVAVVEPGKTVHRAHRHSMEEYLILVSGSGTWSLDGKEFPAVLGDILYVEPWVYHGLTNTGQTPLIFVVVRYNPKGLDIPPKPDDRPNEL